MEQQQNPAQHAKSDMSRIEQIRRKKRERRLRTAVLLVLLLAVLFAYLGGLLAPSINLLSNMVDSAKIALLPGEGWPVAISADPLRICSLSGGVALLDESDLVLYSQTAKELRRVPHGYADPAIVIGNSRVCLYNRGGTELRVESRTRSLFTKAMERPIITVGMSNGGAMAVATKAERYMAEIAVYDPSFNEIYYCYLAEDYPMSIAFASDGKQFAVSCLRVQNGELGTVVRLYNTGREELVGSIALPGTLPLELHYIDAATLLIVGDSTAATYDSTSGAAISRYDYGGKTLLCADYYRKNLALVFGDEKRVAVNRCTVLDATLQPLCEIALGYDVRDVLLGSETLDLIGKEKAVRYDLTGLLVGDKMLETKGLALLRAKLPLALTAKEILQLAY